MSMGDNELVEDQEIIEGGVETEEEISARKEKSGKCAWCGNQLDIQPNSNLITCMYCEIWFNERTQQWVGKFNKKATK